MIIPTLQQTEACRRQRESWAGDPCSPAPESELSTTAASSEACFHISARLHPQPSTAFPPAHSTHHILYTQILFTIMRTFHGLLHHCASFSSCYWLCLECPFFSCPLRKLLFIPQSLVQCHLLGESCPSLTSGRMVCSLPPGPTATCPHYARARPSRLGFMKSERFWNRDVKS